MSPEEFQKIKEAEKAHLRKLKKLKDAVRVLERQKKISGAVTDMTSSIEEKMDEHRSAVERVALDAARAEARLEMALEAADDDVEERSREIDDEQTLREHRAKELIRQIKAGAVDSDAVRPESGDAARPDDGDAVEHSDTGADRAADQVGSDDAPVPDKTIGRMKP